MKNCILLFCLQLPVLLFGQSYFSKLIDTPYPYVGAILGSIETPDSGFILMHISFDVFQDTNKINIVKINKLGSILWKKSYGAQGTAHEQYEIIRTKDSCYVFCGCEWLNDTLSAFLFKINEQGDSIWMKTYNSGFYYGFLGKVIQTESGELISIGGCDRTPVDGVDPWRQIYIVKTDKDGTLQWQKTYGSSNLNDNGRDIVETPEHDFICSGYTRYPYSTNDFFVHGQAMKIDSAGQVKWIKNYTSMEYNQAFIEINKTLDGNYLITGESSNNRYVLTSDPNGTGGTLLKIDAAGNTIWFKRYNDEILDAGCYDFIELPDSSIVTIGFSYQPWERSTLVKFNSYGEIVWIQPYLYNTEFESNEALFKIIHTKDNGFFMTGYAHNPMLDTTGFSIGKGWILKVDSLGCPMPMCTVGTDEPVAPIAPAFFDISPNPTTGTVEVRGLPTEGAGILDIFNLSGILVLQQKVALSGGIQSLSLTGNPRGIYLVRLRSASGSLTRKLILD